MAPKASAAPPSSPPSPSGAAPGAGAALGSTAVMAFSPEDRLPEDLRQLDSLLQAIALVKAVQARSPDVVNLFDSAATGTQNFLKGKARVLASRGIDVTPADPSGTHMSNTEVLAILEGVRRITAGDSGAVMSQVERLLVDADTGSQFAPLLKKGALTAPDLLDVLAAVSLQLESQAGVPVVLGALTDKSFPGVTTGDAKAACEELIKRLGPMTQTLVASMWHTERARPGVPPLFALYNVLVHNMGALVVTGGQDKIAGGGAGKSSPLAGAKSDSTTATEKKTSKRGAGSGAKGKDAGAVVMATPVAGSAPAGAVRDKTCWVCGSSDHLKSDCPQRGKTTVTRTVYTLGSGPHEDAIIQTDFGGKSKDVHVDTGFDGDVVLSAVQMTALMADGVQATPRDETTTLVGFLPNGAGVPASTYDVRVRFVTRAGTVDDMARVLVYPGSERTGERPLLGYGFLKRNGYTVRAMLGLPAAPAS